MSTNATPPNTIDKLVIESEVRRLLSVYAHNLDYGKVDANAELLAAARFNVAGTIVEGRDSIAEFLRTNLQYHVDDTPRTWHSVSNVLIDIESTTAARSICYFTVHQELPGLPLQPIVTGRYIDAFELHNGAWRFASREIEPRLFGDLSKHVPAPAETMAACVR
ncbi:nuclear transport factor 2 family protein [Thalassospira sp.]|uniref:nuclear transport factor 2 family protein n=1 Tax=Thalassospira sp. TaxID=1912094 RepID=UPI003AA88D2A